MTRSGETATTRDKAPKCKIGILSLGCPRNLVDSEGILGRLNSKGYPIVDLEEADVGIVNTCAFIEDAQKESIEAVMGLIGLKKKGKLKKIIVSGCLTQRYKDALIKELPEVDAFTGRVSLGYDRQVFPIASRHYRYLKICESCVNRCSYCVIPKIKGRFQSLDMESVLDKVENFNRAGISELNIVGQDITGYGLDLYGKIRLVELLSRISRKAKDIGWIRLLYMHPSRISDELLDLIKDDPKICKYIDLPIQHINNRILKLMNRNISKKDIFGLIEKIRDRIPAAVLRTSLIVGFPSETEKEFEELLQFVRDIKFERLGAFIYSREDGTPAADFKNQVPLKVKQERLNRVMLQQQEVSADINKRLLGRIMDVLIDEQEEGRYLGRSQHDAPEVDGLVYIGSERKLKPGEFVKVKIEDTLEYDLVGRLWDEHSQ